MKLTDTFSCSQAVLHVSRIRSNCIMDSKLLAEFVEQVTKDFIGSDVIPLFRDLISQCKIEITQNIAQKLQSWSNESGLENLEAMMDDVSIQEDKPNEKPSESQMTEECTVQTVAVVDNTDASATREIQVEQNKAALVVKRDFPLPGPFCFNVPRELLRSNSSLLKWESTRPREYEVQSPQEHIIESFEPDVHSSTLNSCHSPDVINDETKQDQSTQSDDQDLQFNLSVDEADSADAFENAPPMKVVFNQRWIYVAGLEKCTTITQIKNHLANIWPGKTFDVIDMKFKGNCSAFKVGCKELCYNDLLKKSQWPVEATVEIFKSPNKARFKRRRTTFA